MSSEHTNHLSDEGVRERALDPAQSFIVQAPAGSGKTELLIQRYLTLLATVDEPEQIVAITFTRKAAAEMRSRVAAALLAAEAGTPAAHSHEQRTARLAAAVLQRDTARGWELALNPERLRIDTLDALNAWLARRLPVLAGGVAGAGIVEDAAALYREAARRTLDEIHGRGETAAALAALLGHLDNDFPRLEAMLAELLPRRDQWLPYFAQDDDDYDSGDDDTRDDDAHDGTRDGESRAHRPRNTGGLRATLERALRRLVAEELETAYALWPPGLLRDLLPLLEHAARHAGPRDREALAAWLDSEVRTKQSADLTAKPTTDLTAKPTTDLPADRLQNVAAWRAIAHLLLTRDGDWRRRVDKRLGFGPAHAEQRRRLEEVLEALAEHDGLRRAIALVRSLPDPTYSPAEWRALAALRVVLRRAAAELRVVFMERQAVDFVEVALSAQAALGSADAPSDLLLALDQRIRHLLVDEFQDTSHSQLRLLELLTAGWLPGDGRTLFLVGDPMQSIYRFRDADMSLFLRVKRFGVGTVPCESLTLERNFRSASEIVAWINETFARAFPAEDDIGAGAAKFAASRAARDGDPEAAVMLHAIGADADDGDELERTVAVIEEERRRAPQNSLAVLVQSRPHLAGLYARLRERGFDVRARGIEPAREQQIVQDLLGLTRALLHPADRIAWLAVLRAPWCGLTWRNLAALCGDDHALTIPELLRDPARLERLDPDGRARAASLRDTLAEAADRRRTLPLAAWVERTWKSLDGPAYLDDPDDFEHAGRFFAQLDLASRRGDLDDPAELEQLFAKPESGDEEPPATGGLEIMTIHRAKGLEFDTVVVIGLDREPRREASRALYWMQRVANDGTGELVMAPLRGAGENDALCRFVQRAEEARDIAERTRLLYVATTRARRRLHLIWRAPAERSEPSRRSLLRVLWPLAADRFGLEAEAVGGEQVGGEQLVGGRSAESFEPVLRRRTLDALPSGAKGGPTAGPGASHASLRRAHAGAYADGTGERPRRPEFEWAGQPAVQIGTLVHAYLHRIAETGLAAWHADDVLALGPAFRRELRLLGVEEVDIAPAAARVSAALVGVLEDERGRWILERHDEARSELKLTVNAGRALEHVQLDRTFIADGVRWIIDFKTGVHEGADREAFLDAEVMRYRAQLERYAETVAALDPRPIRLALYFPLLKSFRSWAFAG